MVVVWGLRLVARRGDEVITARNLALLEGEDLATRHVALGLLLRAPTNHAETLAASYQIMRRDLSPCSEAHDLVNEIEVFDLDPVGRTLHDMTKRLVQQHLKPPQASEVEEEAVEQSIFVHLFSNKWRITWCRALGLLEEQCQGAMAITGAVGGFDVQKL